MAEYALYLESGPKKTFVHVLELLGCVTSGATAEEAVQFAPYAIRTYLRFLKKHGELIDPEAGFTTTLAEHVTRDSTSSQPTALFQPDYEPMTTAEVETFVKRLEWLRQDLLSLIDSLTPQQMRQEPDEKSRPVQKVLQHLVEQEYETLSTYLGPITPVVEAINHMQAGEISPLDTLRQTHQAMATRLRAMSADERTSTRYQGNQTWTARIMFRRMLEHNWQHRIELSTRLKKV